MNSDDGGGGSFVGIISRFSSDVAVGIGGISLDDAVRCGGVGAD